MSIFTNNRKTKVKRNKFNLSHEKKLSINMGYLYPVVCEPVMPNDYFRVNTEHLIRFHPLVSPLMHRIDAYIHYFFVPNRLVWNEWNNFISGGEDGKAMPPFPNIGYTEQNKAHFKTGQLADYFGIPTYDGTEIITANTGISALPFRAYQLIYNEYYRDENLCDKLPLSVGNVVDTAETNIIMSMRKRAWHKDYFTSALPWTQKGDEILIPIEVDPVYKDLSIFKDGLGNIQANKTLMSDAVGNLKADTGITGRLENIDTMTNGSASINDLRKSIHLQKWLERNARAGSRITEFLYEHFGVISDDLRLSRPQYLGGGKSNVTISEVLASWGNDTDMPLGNMGGHALSVGNTNRFKSHFKEHGHIIGIMSVIPQNAYQQGLPKHFTKFDKFDFAFPEFANLGEQPISSQELYFDPQGVSADNEKVFGYTPRYSEYKFGINTVHGDFRTSLKHWTATREFGSRPELNQQFIDCDTVAIDNKIFAVSDSQASQKLYVQLYNDIKVMRCLPVYGTPTL